MKKGEAISETGALIKGDFGATFKPDELAEAIKAYQTRIGALDRERAELVSRLSAYVTLLRLDGGPEYREVLAQRIERVTRSSERRGRPETIADAAAQSLACVDKFHASEILEILRQRDMLLTQHAMSSLVTAMTRDSRIERVEGEFNTWRLEH